MINGTDKKGYYKLDKKLCEGAYGESISDTSIYISIIDEYIVFKIAELNPLFNDLTEIVDIDTQRISTINRWIQLLQYTRRLLGQPRISLISDPYEHYYIS